MREHSRSRSGRTGEPCWISERKAAAPKNRPAALANSRKGGPGGGMSLLGWPPADPGNNPAALARQTSRRVSAERRYGQAWGDLDLVIVSTFSTDASVREQARDASHSQCGLEGCGYCQPVAKNSKLSLCRPERRRRGFGAPPRPRSRSFSVNGPMRRPGGSPCRVVPPCRSACALPRSCRSNPPRPLPYGSGTRPCRRRRPL
ncbi:hypothetical protein D3C73_449220 [compost metagenome]